MLPSTVASAQTNNGAIVLRTGEINGNEGRGRREEGAAPSAYHRNGTLKCQASRCLPIDGPGRVFSVRRAERSRPSSATGAAGPAATPPARLGIAPNKKHTRSRAARLTATLPRILGTLTRGQGVKISQGVMARPTVSLIPARPHDASRGQRIRCRSTTRCPSWGPCHRLAGSLMQHGTCSDTGLSRRPTRQGCKRAGCPTGSAPPLLPCRVGCSDRGRSCHGQGTL